MLIFLHGSWSRAWQLAVTHDRAGQSGNATNPLAFTLPAFVPSLNVSKWRDSISEGLEAVSYSELILTPFVMRSECIQCEVSSGSNKSNVGAKGLLSGAVG